jgi:6-phosphogluconolactonase
MKLFKDRESASVYVAGLIEGTLAKRLNDKQRCTFVASGGSTPVNCLKRLSRAALDWARIDVTLTDEREVPVDHDASNEKMVRENLLVEYATSGQFIQLHSQQISSSQPFACTLVGMGDDGHFASIFPDSPQMQEALQSKFDTVKVSTPSSPYTRITMTLNTIANSESIILLVFGELKRNILDNPAGYPIDELLQRKTVTIVWAP